MLLLSLYDKLNPIFMYQLKISIRYENLESNFPISVEASFFLRHIHSLQFPRSYL